MENTDSTQKQIKSKIDILENKLELEESFFKSNNKAINSMLILGTLSLVIMVVVYSFFEEMKPIQVLSISLLVNSLYKLTFDYLDIRNSYKKEILLIKNEIEYYKTLLKK